MEKINNLIESLIDLELSNRKLTKDYFLDLDIETKYFYVKIINILKDIKITVSVNTNFKIINKILFELINHFNGK